MNTACRHITPDALSEEYYQISPEILGKFPKHRPPLTLYVFREDSVTLVPTFLQGCFLNKDKQEELGRLCTEGRVFVARTDHPIYAQHISEQLDLVLLDQNLKEQEIIEIFQCSLPRRIDAFLDQPVKETFTRLQSDILVLTEYIWNDPFRIRGLFRHLYRDNDLSRHEYNVGIVGLLLYLIAREKELHRKTLDRLALGLFIHDIGLRKIPQFVLAKTTTLKREEEDKIRHHPLVGARVIRNLGIAYDEVVQCVLEHHERLDGSGYPQKKRDREISISGKICALADSFSAMTSQRPYSACIPPAEAAVALLQDRKYDKRLATILLSALHTI
ncbi:MAG: HD-GYP domain-containing protein [Desulfovibrionales bacterium]